MKTVRRLYFYLVALISIEVVTWGLINLLRSILGDSVGGDSLPLAQALALIVVGLPIFLFHWLWVQRTSASDEEERTAGLRAIFFYGILLATLMPLVQNLFALLNRGALQLFSMQVGRAILGSRGGIVDNLIGIAINGVVALYFWSVLRTEWETLPAAGDFADVRRLYRYVWVIYGLLIAVFGAQQILRYIFYVPGGLLGGLTRETFVNGLALILIGAPLWAYAWNVVQESLGDPAEHDSNLRIGVLYLLALGGVITVLTAGATVLHTLLDWLIGVRMTTSEVLDKIGGPLSIGVPLAAIWAYYSHWLNRHIDSIAEPVRRAGMKRVYAYILSAVGLGGTFLGIATLIFFVIRLTVGGFLVMDDTLRTDLGRSIAVTVAWLPLWVLVWRRLQAESASAGDIGDHARRSVVRRGYLYLALFAGVIGGMIVAVGFVFQLVNAALSGERESTFLVSLLNNLQLLVLFVVLLVYHLMVMRADGRSAAAALAARQKAFKLLVLDTGKGFGAAVKSALTRVAPGISATVTARQPRGKFDAIILSGSDLLKAPVWVRLFKGKRIVVPDESSDIHWAGSIDSDPIHKAAFAARQMAEGQLPSRQVKRTGWMIVVYIAAVLFGLEVLLILLGSVFSAFMY